MNRLPTDWLLFAILIPAEPVLFVGTYLGGILGVLCRDLADA